MPKVRNEEIDILKGLAILAVVLGHTRFFGTHFIYLFHMAVFFMASGYFYKDKYSDSFKNVFDFVLHKIKGLWLPFVIWNTIYTLLNNVFIKINIYTANESIRDYIDESLVGISSYLSIREMLINIIKGLFLAGHTGMGGAFWFLRVLFYIHMLYVMLDYVLKRFIHKEHIVLICQGIISSVFLCIGYIMGLKDIDVFAINLAMSCYILYYMGHLLGMRPVSEMKTYISILLLIVCGGFLYVMGLFGTISVGNNEYVNPVYYLVASVLGWFMLYGLSSFFKHIAPVKKIFIIIGQNSLSIVIFHFLSFKIVNYIYTLVKGFPLYVVAGFPVSVNTGAWWILYAIVGVTIPVLLSIMWKKFSATIVRKAHSV